MSEKSVVLLPESEGCLVCARYRGRIRKVDFDLLHNKIEAVYREAGCVRLFVVFDESFTGWEPDAAESNLLSITTYAPKIERIAYVNPSAQKIFQLKLQRPMFKGLVRFFNETEYQEALDWVRK
ncbi:MAG: STAS/SEC14 domain-containing protein [Alphaproteobacteria bacterium]|nr:STAS/SEC14 domain-containing protein [Alphaproteobacteria bacterium]